MTDASPALDALGDGTRRAILEQIARGPRSVGEIARKLPVSRPAVSQHLKVLSRAGLVRCESSGTRRIYALCPEGIEAVRTYLDRFWDRALMSFKSAVEQAAKKERTRP